MRIIFHIDVNNAFLSWTAVYLLNKGYNIDIRTIPSVIGGDEEKRHGVVLAKSPIAKKYGIVTGESLYEARKKCKNLKVYPPIHSYYEKKSKELMNYLRGYSPDLEQYSIDECFLDMTGTNYLYDNYVELAYNIKDDIKRKFGYTVNVGVANNKLCAKMASDFEKPDKVHTLFQNEIEEKLWPLKVEDLFMCGKATAKELNKLNIYTIKDLSNAPYSLLEKHFKSQAKYLKEASLGIDNSKVETKRRERQSISTTITLSHDEDNPSRLKEIIFRQTEDLARKLREEKMYAGGVAIIYKDSNFKNYSYQERLENETNSTKEILESVNNLFDKSYKQEKIRLIGVRLSNLSKTKSTQISLFNNTEVEKDDAIQNTIDEINKKFGTSILSRASIKTLESKSKSNKNQQNRKN